MKSRTSFFNATVFWKDITRFAPAWVLYFIGSSLVLAISSFSLVEGDDTFVEGILVNMQTITFVHMFYALIVAQMLFGDLFIPRHCNTLHAMPLRRETWFSTHFIAGLLYSFVPNLLLALPITLFCGSHWYVGLVWLLSAILEYLFFFCTAIFSIMCAGKKFASTSIYLLMHFLTFIIYWFVDVFYIPLLPGISLDAEVFAAFCPLIYLSGHSLLDYTSDYVSVDPLYPYGDLENIVTINGLGSGWWYLWILATLGLVFAGLSLLMYRKRRLESAGDFVSARWLAPVFSLIYTLCVGALFHLLFGGYSIFLPVGLAVGYFTGQMLLQRKVNVFQGRRFAAFGIITAVLLGSIGLTWLDPLGVTRYVPKASQVKSVSINDGNFSNMLYDHLLINAIIPPGYTYDGYYTTDPAQIGKVIDLHEAFVEETTSLEGKITGSFSSDTRNTVSIIYTLKNGQHIRRSYEIPEESEAGQQAAAFFSSPEYVFRYDDWDTYLSSVTEIEVYPYTLRGEDVTQLLTAMKADCDLGRMNTYDGNYKSTVTILAGNEWNNITVRSGCNYTISWLNEHCPGWD